MSRVFKDSLDSEKNYTSDDYLISFVRVFYPNDILLDLFICLCNSSLFFYVVCLEFPLSNQVYLSIQATSERCSDHVCIVPVSPLFYVQETFNLSSIFEHLAGTTIGRLLTYKTSSKSRHLTWTLFGTIRCERWV